MRLDRYLANSGVGSRSEVKNLIKKKLVKVDGVVVKSASLNINENVNKVYVNDTLIEYQEFYYILLNKPLGYVSAVEDNIYPPVTDLVEEYRFAKLFPVGRLDVDTTGALLLTNNGVLCHQLLSPKYHVDKTYTVETDLEIKSNLIKAFKEGIILDGEKTLPGELVILDKTKAELTIHQGKFHQVKRMFQHFGLTVTKLDRKSFAFLTHEDIPLGEYRLLTNEEVERLIEIVESK